MSVIVQQPDSLSFAGNLKKFVVTSAVAVALQLNKGAEQILNEIYQPSAGSIVEIDLRTVIDKVLSVTLPGTNLITEQSSGFADFTATIDGTAVAFRVIKGGVLELGSMAGDFVNEHFLTWQIQDKQILQIQPEWLTVYTNAARNLKAKAYYQDNTNASMLLTALAANKLLAVDVSWASINALFVKKNPIAWEVWFEDLAGTRLSYVQRYCLRNSDDEEKIFIWANTMGGIDSISLTGSAEDDKKLEHLIAEMGDESLQEYQTDKKREIKQSTGFLTVDESRWIEDFFYSGRRYLVGEDGAVRSIVLASSKIVGSTADDLFDYEFNYRLASESQLLNLERSFDSLPALEVPVDFFLTELLSGLPVAQYSDGLLMAVQSPFAQAWQKLSMAQLWGSALPGLVDGTTISVVNGKLQVNGVSGGVGVSKWGDLTEKPFSTLSNLFSVSPEGVLTLSNNYAAANHTHPYLSDSDARIGNWTTAYNWGDHAGKYRPIAWVPAWADISNKPEWVNRMGWDGTATVVSSDMHIIGKLVVDGTIQFFGSGAGGGTGGGGASALWELTDVADDMVNSIYGDLPMYNGTHFARYNISNFATVGHGHTIAQVTGLQGSLDGKQSLLGYTPYYSANFVAGVNYSAPHSHPYLSDSDARIVNWSTAFGWGNHAGLYRPIGYVPSWGEITSKPTWTEKFGWDGAAVTVSTDMHITGKLVVDGTIQFFGAGAGGTGGGGSTTLWGLSDVDDDVQNSVYGDLIMYNGTHFARINQSVLAPAVHMHTISQVNGLQGALDGKQATGSYVLTSDGRLSDSRVASDVYAWAKAGVKPSYSFSELTARPTTLEGYGITNAQPPLNGQGIVRMNGTGVSYDTTAYWYSGSHPTTVEGYGITNAQPPLNGQGIVRMNGTGVSYDATSYQPSIIGLTTNYLSKWNGSSFSNSLIFDNGYIGIGTTSPNAKLTVRAIALAINGPILSLQADFSGAIGNHASIQFGDASQTTLYQKGAIIYEGVSGSARGKFHIALNNEDNANNVVLADSKFTVLSNGYIGVGNVTPEALLDLGASGGQKFYLYDGSGVKMGFGVDLSGTSREMSMFCSTSNGTDGNISFGRRLESSGVYTETMRLSGSGLLQTYNTIRTDINKIGASFIGTGSGSNFQVWHDGTGTVQLINSGGAFNFASNIGLGTITPEAPLEIYRQYAGDAIIISAPVGTGNKNTIAWNHSKTTGVISARIGTVDDGNYGGNIVFENRTGVGMTTSEKMRIQTDGKLLVGYTSDPNGVSLFAVNGAGYFAGNVIANGTMQFYTASDRRLKTDFESIINPIEKIKSLTGYFFNYTDQAMALGGYANRRDIGLIAQDVHAILPEATGKLWNSDFMGYKADKLIPLLVEAIKQQQNQIDELKRQA